MAALPVGQDGHCAGSLELHRKQALEELAVPRQRDAQILGGSLFTTGPLLLEPRSGCAKPR